MSSIKQTHRSLLESFILKLSGFVNSIFFFVWSLPFFVPHSIYITIYSLAQFCFSSFLFVDFHTLFFIFLSHCLDWSKYNKAEKEFFGPNTCMSTESLLKWLEKTNCFPVSIRQDFYSLPLSSSRE